MRCQVALFAHNLRGKKTGCPVVSFVSVIANIEIRYFPIKAMQQKIQIKEINDIKQSGYSRCCHLSDCGIQYGRHRAHKQLLNFAYVTHLSLKNGFGFVLATF